jgi:hypothetical protein
MPNLKIVRNTPSPSRAETTQQIEETAYYKWLDRGRLSQVSDEVSDWIEAEKEVDAQLKPKPVASSV